MAPRFITFEGLDGSGKSTHLRRAVAWLRDRGLDVVQTHEPGGTALGEAIRNVFLDPRWGDMDGRVEAMLVFASRRQHLIEVIEPALAAGQCVVCDRFTDSTIAYQGHGRGLSVTWITALDRLATEERQPDLTLVFDLPAPAARDRGQSQSRRDAGDADRIDVEGVTFYSRVRAGYRALAAAHPQRLRIIDSSGTKDQTWAQVERVLMEVAPR